MRRFLFGLFVLAALSAGGRPRRVAGPCRPDPGVARRGGGLRPDDPGARGRRAHRARLRPVAVRRSGHGLRPDRRRPAHRGCGGQGRPAGHRRRGWTGRGIRPGASVDVVGYSMGGLVARYLIEKAGWAGGSTRSSCSAPPTTARSPPGSRARSGVRPVERHRRRHEARVALPGVDGPGRTGRRTVRRHRRCPELAPVPLRRAGRRLRSRRS